MTDLPSLMIGLALANYFVLVPLLARDPLHETNALPAGLATALALLPAAALTWAVDAWLLGPPGLAPQLGLLVALLAALAMTPLALRLRRFVPAASLSPAALGLPLTTVNSALLMAALWAAGRLTGSLTAALLWAAGTGIGFLVIMVLFAGLRERLEAAEVPAALRGPAIALVTAGFLSLALGGIGSIVRG